ncbi:MAG: CehA/McbA family metallohydrolase [Kiritimatiellae bacterium]|nr:CehA/McbA family metallohydrolase [Kiritimatiellia bacterium]
MKHNQDMWNDQGVWLKGNIHTHTVHSDGKCTPGELALEYGRHGYDFVFLTDHDKYTAPKTQTRKPLLIPATELAVNFRGYCHHFVCLGVKKEWQSASFRSPGQLLARAGREGVFVVQAHPYWCGIPSHKCVFKGNLTCAGVEVYNTVCDRLNAKGYSAVHWDDLLDAGRRLLGFAVDDAHNITHIAGGWIMVKTPARTPAAILAAIRRGNFYSSQGPEIKSIRVRGREIKIICSPVMRINFIANRARGCSIFATIPSLKEAVWTVPAENTYARIELVDWNGKTAWSNPVYFRR